MLKALGAKFHLERAVSPLLVSALTALVFWPSLRYGFVSYDDALLLHGPGRDLSWSSIRWLFSHQVQGNYAPLSALTYAVDFVLGGRIPRGYHLTAVLFHSANAALFFLLALDLLSLGGGASAEENRAAAFVAALLFSVHPMRISSVAWISERRDVVCGFFTLLTVLLWVRDRTRAALAAFACALLSKPAALPLPAALVLLDYWPLRRPLDWKRYAPFAALATPAAVVAVVSQSRDGAVIGLAVSPPLERLHQILVGSVYYLGKTLWPAGLGLYEWHWPAVRTAVVLGAAATAAALAAAYRKPALRKSLLTALAFQTLMLAPVLGFVTIGHELVADRYSYLACLGWALAAAAGLRVLSARRPRAAAALAGAVLAACVASTRAQLPVWRDSESLWRNALRADPLSWGARQNLANALLDQGRVPEALNYLEDHMRLYPKDAEVRAQLAEIMEKNKLTGRERARERVRLGIEAEGKGNLTLAIWHFEAALILEPGRDDATAELQKARAAAR